ncbi:aldehyde dehydrogenase family protein [Streptomyces sp. NPDC056486]|uniref:aldehyde dehydrogenase family protein n=1 Tax=Streptomyces sp. NPDC056486 TaxID=3345835 RepID=UPI0036C5B595
MNTEQDQTEAPPPPSSSVADSRPAWVSGELLEQWCGWVHRDQSRQEADALGPVTALAPWDLTPIAPVPACTPKDVESAASAARAAQRDWARTPLARRAGLVLAFHDLLLQRQDQVLDLIQWETGKARYHAWQEVAQVAAIARHYARRSARYLTTRRVRGMVPGLTKVAELRVPKGVVGISAGHPVEQVLAHSRWHGKRFIALDDAKPLICLAQDGSLYSDTTAGRGEASLWNVEFRGEVTATMVYDGMPVFDHFKRVDDNTLLGVMNGKASAVSASGHLFYFGLERE